MAAALSGEPRKIGLGCGGLHAPLLAEDVGEPRLDIARHALRIAADITVGALFEPRPQLAGALEQPMPGVDLAFLVTREGGVEASQQPVAATGQQLLLEEKVAAAMRIAEDEPIAARRPDRAPLCRKARNGATPVPGPIMMIGVSGDGGSRKPGARRTKVRIGSPGTSRSLKKVEATPSRWRARFSFSSTV